MTDAEFEKAKREIYGETIKKPEPKVDPRFTERRDGTTPSGGDYSIAYYYNEEGLPCEKQDADFVNIIEYKTGGIRVNEHYASLSKSR